MQRNEWCLGEIAAELPPDVAGTAGGILQHLRPAHAMPHQKHRDIGAVIASQLRLQDRGHVGQHGARGPRQAAAGGGCDGAAPSALVEAAGLDPARGERGEERVVGIDVVGEAMDEDHDGCGRCAGWLAKLINLAFMGTPRIFGRGQTFHVLVYSLTPSGRMCSPSSTVVDMSAAESARAIFEAP